MIRFFIINLFFQIVFLNFNLLIAETLDLKLSCKSLNSNIISNNGNFVEIEDNVFFVNIKVNKLSTPIPAYSKLDFPDLTEEIIIEINGPSELYSPLIKNYIGLTKSGPVILSDTEISVIADTSKPDIKWNFSLNRYTGTIKVIAIFNDQNSYEVTERKKLTNGDMEYTVKVSDKSEYLVSGPSNVENTKIILLVKERIKIEKSPFQIKSIEGVCKKGQKQF